MKYLYIFYEDISCCVSDHPPTDKDLILVDEGVLDIIQVLGCTEPEQHIGGGELQPVDKANYNGEFHAPNLD